MTRLLIRPSALAELRAIEPLERRRAVVLALSELGSEQPGERLAAGGRCRRTIERLAVLYQRGEGGVCIYGVRPLGVETGDHEG